AEARRAPVRSRRAPHPRHPRPRGGEAAPRSTRRRAAGPPWWPAPDAYAPRAPGPRGARDPPPDARCPSGRAPGDRCSGRRTCRGPFVSVKGSSLAKPLGASRRRWPGSGGRTPARRARSPPRRRPPPPPPRPLAGTRLAEALIAGWQPLQRLAADGFAVLRSRGITRRAHSIVALEPPTGTAELAAALDRVESLVTRVGESPVHRILEGVTPPQLETLLAERGDEPVGDSEVLELPLRGTLPRPHPSAVISTGALDEDWFEAAWRLAPRDGEQARGTMHD